MEGSLAYLDGFRSRAGVQVIVGDYHLKVAVPPNDLDEDNKQNIYIDDRESRIAVHDFPPEVVEILPKGGGLMPGSEAVKIGTGALMIHRSGQIYLGHNMDPKLMSSDFPSEISIGTDGTLYLRDERPAVYLPAVPVPNKSGSFWRGALCGALIASLAWALAIMGGERGTAGRQQAPKRC